jgi:hypothetical protein
MKKSGLATAVAKRRGVEHGAAADQLDRAVTRIIRALRRGQRAHLPGLGTIAPGKPWIFYPEQNPEGKNDAGEQPHEH